ncbi:hypothetical protein VN0196_07600 [Helicobacter pylori]
MDKRSSKQKECRENREPIYIKAEIDKADIIHSFIPQARTLKEQADGVGLHLKYKTKTLISQGVRRR